MAEILKNLPLLGPGGYHDPANGYVSHSRLHDFIERGPAFFEGRYITGEVDREETDALVFGQALEDLVQLGGDVFASRYAVRPAHLKGNTKAGQQWKAAQGGRICLTDDQYQLMLEMAASLRTCDKGIALTNGCDQQVTLRGEVFGLRMQARPDWLHLSDLGVWLVDLKTTRDLNEFLRRDGPAVVRFGYHTQAALMRKLLAANGYEDATVYLFVVEKQLKPRRACFRVPDDYLAWADKLLEAECAKLKACMDAGVYPNGPDEIITLNKPRWAKDEQPMEAQP